MAIFNIMDISGLMLIYGLFLVNFAGLYATLSSSNLYNVLDYGAVSDPHIDSSQAFLDAWNATCKAEEEDTTLIVPSGYTFLVHPIVFLGPCKANRIEFLILGRITAPDTPLAWEKLDPRQWLAFRAVTGVRILGSGTVDGQGFGWWNQSCRYHPHLIGCTKLAPTAMKFLSCNETAVTGINFVNSPQTHITATGCNGLHIDAVSIEAPEHSPNTDGIHIQHARNIFITNSIIQTGDDCVSIGDYTSNINIFNLTCGPGHGVSIGSLGRGGNYVQVENIFVSNVYFKGTTNGARIKTWQAGKGYVRRVTFQKMFFNAVEKPVIIDQNYCDVRGACLQKERGVWISEVTYKELYGTSTSKVAINLNCSSLGACTDITLQSIILWPAQPRTHISSNCTNAFGVAIEPVEPPSCLLEQEVSLGKWNKSSFMFDLETRLTK